MFLKHRTAIILISLFLSPFFFYPSNVFAADPLNNLLLKIEQEPEVVPHYMRLGNYYRARGDYETAEKYYRMPESFAPGHVDIYMHLGVLYQEMKRFDLAEEFGKKAIEADPEKWDAYYHLARTYVAAGASEKAEAAFQEMTRHHPADPWVYQGFAQFQKSRGNLESAAELLEKFLEFNPQLWDIRIDLARIYSGLNQEKKAIFHYREALRLQPDVMWIYFELLDVYKNQDLKEMARGVLMEANEKHPEWEEVSASLSWDYFEEANHFLESGDFSRYIKIMKEVIRLNPKEVAHYMRLGNYYREAGDFETAEKYYRMPESFAPGHVDIWMHLGILYRELEKYDLAEEYGKKAIEADPEKWDVYSHYAFLMKDLGRIEEAVTNFQKAAALAPGEDWIYSEILRLCEGIGKKEEYRKLNKYFQVTAASQPESAGAWFYLGVTHHRLWEYRPAEEAVKKALGLSQKKEWFFELARIYWETWRFEEARQTFQQGLDFEPEKNKFYHYDEMKEFLIYSGDFRLASIYAAKASRAGV